MTEPEIIEWLGLPPDSGYQLRPGLRELAAALLRGEPVPVTTGDQVACFRLFLQAKAAASLPPGAPLFTVECRHCGQAASGYAIVADEAGNDVRVCHPSDPLKPDCYRRITVYHEPLGALATPWALPMGIEGIRRTEPLPEDQR